MTPFLLGMASGAILYWLNPNLAIVTAACALVIVALEAVARVQGRGVAG